MHIVCLIDKQLVISFDLTSYYCDGRWFNCLDPSLRRCEWTEEEDLRLEIAIQEHGYSWAKVAACVPSRTDNECRR